MIVWLLVLLLLYPHSDFVYKWISILSSNDFRSIDMLVLLWRSFHTIFCFNAVMNDLIWFWMLESIDQFCCFNSIECMWSNQCTNQMLSINNYWYYWRITQDNVLNTNNAKYKCTKVKYKAKLDTSKKGTRLIPNKICCRCCYLIKSRNCQCHTDTWPVVSKNRMILELNVLCKDNKINQTLFAVIII